MKRILLAAASLLVFSTYGAADAFADCPAAPLASTSDMVVSFLAANGTQAAPSTAIASSVKEGMLIYDNTADALKICNGTAWQTLAVGGGGVTAAGSVTGAVQFRGAGGNLAADDTNFVWDDTNDKLGVGTATPFAKLSVNSGASPYTIQAVGTTQASFMLSGTYGQVYNGAGDLYLTNNGANAIIFRLSGSTETMRISNTGAVGVGTASPNASALVDISSTSKGFLPPRMTTTDVGNIATPADGLMVYDTDTDTIKLRANGAWVSLMGGSGSETDPQVGTLTATKWCAANAGGTAIDCTVDAPATGAAGAANEVQFRNSGTGAFAANASFVWDNTNARLGVGVTAPNAALEVQRAGFPVTIEQRNYVTDANTQRAVSAIVLANTTAAAADGFGPTLRFDIIDNTTGTDITTNAGLMADIGAVRAGANNSAALVFRTNNAGTLTEKVRITKDGNVGIGATTPGAKLDVSGNILMSAVNPTVTFNSGGPSISVPAANTLTFSTSGLERVRVDNNGSLGIGTTSPRGKLDVNGAVRLKFGAPANDSAAVGLAFEDNGDTGLFMTNYTSSADGDLNLYVNAQAKMTVLGSGANSGFVGIGTTAPASLLHVAGGVQLGNDAASCVAAKYGTLRYASDSLELCGTSGWVSLVSGALVSGTGAAGTLAAAVTNSGWQNYPGTPTLALPSAGTYFVTSQVYYTYGAGCGDVLMNWSGSNILYKSTDSKWQACGASGTSNWSTYSHVITVSAATTLNAQYTWTNAGTSGNTQFGGSKFVKLNTGSGGGGGGGGGTPGGATTQVQYNDGGSFAGSANLVWDNTNSRLGIGTTTPAQKLDVVGTATANGVILKPAAGAAAPSAGTQVWESDGTHAWRATGNVGVGTASPSYKLHVAGDGYITTSLGVGAAPSATIGTYSLKTGTNADGHGIYGYGNKVATASGTYYSAGAYNVARSTVSSGVTDSGWIMGTNVSSLRATAGDAGTLASVFGQYVLYGNHSGATSNPTTTNAYGVYIGPYQQTGTITNNYSLYLAAPTTGGTVTNNYAVYQASTAQKNYFAGNIGIGVTSPSQAFEMTGNISMNDGGTIYGSDSSTANTLVLQAALNAYDGARFIAYGRTSSAPGQARMVGATFTNNTTVSHYFQNYQNSSTNNTLGLWRSNGDLVVYGSVTTCVIGVGSSTTACSSDERLKKDIKPIEGALDSLVRLNGVTFKWRDPKRAPDEHVGLIAQEVQKEFPQLVITDEDGYLKLDYAGLVAPIIQAVKELNAKRTDLEAKVAAQGTEIENLKSQNADILKRLEALEVSGAKQ